MRNEQDQPENQPHGQEGAHAGSVRKFTQGREGFASDGSLAGASVAAAAGTVLPALPVLTILPVLPVLPGGSTAAGICTATRGRAAAGGAGARHGTAAGRGAVSGSQFGGRLAIQRADMRPHARQNTGESDQKQGQEKGILSQRGSLPAGSKSTQRTRSWARCGCF
jgi:hypothetical protein